MSIPYKCIIAVVGSLLGGIGYGFLLCLLQLLKVMARLQSTTVTIALLWIPLSPSSLFMLSMMYGLGSSVL